MRFTNSLKIWSCQSDALMTTPASTLGQNEDPNPPSQLVGSRGRFFRAITSARKRKSVRRPHPFEMIGELTDQETQKFLDMVCQPSHRREVMGMATAIFYRRRKVRLFVTGVAVENPGFASGHTGAMTLALWRRVLDTHES